MKYTKESLFKQCEPNFPRVSLRFAAFAETRAQVEMNELDV